MEATEEIIGSEWVQHLKKLHLQLTCPQCLEFLDQPKLLPCDHICCSSCIVASVGNARRCPTCNISFPSQEVRCIQHIETIATTIKSLDAIFAAKVIQSKSQSNTPGKSCPYTTPGPNSSDIGEKMKTRMNPSNQKPPYIYMQSCSAAVENIQLKQDHCDEQHVDVRYPSNHKRAHEEPLASSNCAEKSYDCIVERVTCQIEDPPVGEEKRRKLNFEVDSSRTSEKDSNLSGGVDGLDENIVTPISKSELKHSDDTSTMVCVFCKSPRTSKDLGPMLHISNRRFVDDDQAMTSNVKHVHRSCFDWAPLIYFVGDTINNFEAEVSRASKIKCSKCGKKGAALGCYVKHCRRSYHVPCALEIPKCRWDGENYLLLCPAHISHPFPNDRSKTERKVKHVDSLINLDSSETPEISSPMTQQCDFSKSAIDIRITRELVLCGSSLSAVENVLLEKFAKITGAMISNRWSQNVTHVVTSTDEFGGCKRSKKFLMAILNGNWILSIDWMKACLESKDIVDEKHYEINHDIHGFFDGPRIGRMRKMEKAPALFSGLSFYFNGRFLPSTMDLLEDLISIGGGTVIKDADMLNHLKKTLPPTSYVVYSVDALDRHDKTDCSELIKKRFEEAEVIACDYGCEVVPSTWILDSIAACKLQPLLVC